MSKLEKHRCVFGDPVLTWCLEEAIVRHEAIRGVRSVWHQVGV
jgi:hypothetical protein